MADEQELVKVQTTNPGPTTVGTRQTVGVDGLVKSVGVLANKATDELCKVRDYLDNSLRVAVNADVTPPARKKNSLPSMPEVDLIGWDAGKSRKFRAVKLDGFYLEKITGYDFALMKRAAAEDGIRLDIISAWRSYDQQKRLYFERMNPDGSLTRRGEQLGRAAKPGYSNHQDGTALDIYVKMTIADRENGAKSAEFRWLEANAHRFGFDNTEAPEEPWHWRHRSTTLVATLDAQQDVGTLETLVNAGVAMSEAMKSDRGALPTYLARDVYDRVQGYARAAQIATTSRDNHWDWQAASAAHRGGALSNYTSEYSQAATVADQPRQGFDSESVAPLEFDFDTGLWGDGKIV